MYSPPYSCFCDFQHTVLTEINQRIEGILQKFVCYFDFVKKENGISFELFQMQCFVLQFLYSVSVNVHRTMYTHIHALSVTTTKNTAFFVSLSLFRGVCLCSTNLISFHSFALVKHLHLADSLQQSIVVACIAVCHCTSMCMRFCVIFLWTPYTHNVYQLNRRTPHDNFVFNIYNICFSSQHYNQNGHFVEIFPFFSDL